MHVCRGQKYGAWFQSAAASRGRGSVVVGGAHPVPLLDVMPNGAFPAMLTISPHRGSGASRMSGATRRRALHITPPSPLSCPFGFVRDATDAGPAGCRECCVVRCESLCLFVFVFAARAWRRSRDGIRIPSLSPDHAGSMAAGGSMARVYPGGPRLTGHRHQPAMDPEGNTISIYANSAIWSWGVVSTRDRLCSPRHPQPPTPPSPNPPPKA